MPSHRQSKRNRENIYIAYHLRHNFIRVINLWRKSSSELIFKEEIHVLFNVQFCLFSTKFLSGKVTKFTRFCGGKICNAHKQLPGDSGPLINQSECTYYRSHIIMDCNEMIVTHKLLHCKEIIVIHKFLDCYEIIAFTNDWI